MRKEAAAPDPRLDEARLLVEAGFLGDARRQAESLRAERPDDPERLALLVWIDQRRGAISLALDGWRRLHEARPSGGEAVALLARLRVEESGAVAQRSDRPLVRRVLRLVATGQNDRALVASAQGRAAATAGGDREQQKLLALIEALVHELAGRPSAAVAVLTALGEDPAFAQDVDRLAILARVCEQAGDAAGLQAAERVLGFLASSGIVSAFPRLLQIRRSLGDEAGATAVERAWEEAFRSRIHRFSAAERIAAAARCYVTAERLALLELPAAASLEDPLQRAIAQVVEGKAEAALPHLGRTPAWRAEALLALGDCHQAAAAAAEAIVARPDVPHALLLARCAGEGIELPAPALGAARQILAGVRASGVALPPFLEAAARIETRCGGAERAERLLVRAAAARQRQWPPPGLVRAAAIYTMPGRQVGLVHDLIARPLPPGGRERGRLVDAEIHGELDRGVRQQLRRIFAAVRETLAARYPERAACFDACGWSIHFTKEDEPSGGPSLGLPAAIAFASALLDKPVPQGLVFTGAVSYDAAAHLAVRPVGDLGKKIEAVLHAGAERLVFPAAQREEALSAQVVPALFAREVAAPVGSFDEALALVLGDEP
ncbi:S16 family serine protease [Vulgatibacter sp.]|uniref:S16 family serine protease n=1 Tax=Vulgatibacter sp. TaxID=1971226 RepID=UPI00356A5ED7